MGTEIKKNWFRRHWIISTLIFVFIILPIIIGIFGEFNEESTQIKEEYSKQVKDQGEESTSKIEGEGLPEFISKGIRQLTTDYPQNEKYKVRWWAKNFDYISIEKKLVTIPPKEIGEVPEKWAIWGVEAMDKELVYVFNLSLSSNDEDNSESIENYNLLIPIKQFYSQGSICFEDNPNDKSPRYDIVTAHQCCYNHYCGDYTWAYYTESSRYQFYCPLTKKVCRDFARSEFNYS